nr:hypothetical protein [Tanacetum cinerariifolium]
MFGVRDVDVGGAGFDH